jgi:drug/metabolite transporter (DMT)-like permease
VTAVEAAAPGTVRTVRDRGAAPLGAASAAIVGWGIGPLFVRAISASSPTIVLHRLLIAVPVMVVIAYATGGRMSWTLTRRALIPGVLFALSMMTSFASFQKTTIVNATLIPALQPVLLLVIARRFLGEHRTRNELMAGGVAIAGVILVIVGGRGGGEHGIAGDLLAVANVIVWTAYFLWSKRVRDDGVHSWSWLGTVFCVAAAFVIPWALVVSDDLGAIEGLDWLWLVGMVVGPGLIGHGGMTWAQRYLDVTVASLLTLGNPVISILGAWLVFGQGLRPLQLLGAVVAFGGLAGIVTHQRRAATAPAVGDG